MPSVQPLTDDQARYLWIRNNRGVCSQISRDCSVSTEFVRQIFYNVHPNQRSKDLRVERALYDAGAPFMRERMEVAQ